MRNRRWVLTMVALLAAELLAYWVILILPTLGQPG